WGLARGRVAVMSRGLSDGEAATRVAVYGAGVWGARAGGCGSGLPPQFDDLAGGGGVEDVLGAFVVEDMTCRGGVGLGEGGVSALRGEVFVVGVVTGQPPQFDEVIALADVVDVVRALAPEQVAGWRADRDRGRADAGAVRGQVAGDRIVLALPGQLDDVRVVGHVEDGVGAVRVDVACRRCRGRFIFGGAGGGEVPGRVDGVCAA